MHIFAAILGLVSAVAAGTGSSIVVNISPDPFYLWIVPDEVGAPIGNRIAVSAGVYPPSNKSFEVSVSLMAECVGGAWAEPLREGRLGNSSTPAGVAIKMSKDQEGLYNSAPLLILAYTLSGERVW